MGARSSQAYSTAVRGVSKLERRHASIVTGRELPRVSLIRYLHRRRLLLRHRLPSLHNLPRHHLHLDAPSSLTAAAAITDWLTSVSRRRVATLCSLPLSRWTESSP